MAGGWGWEAMNTGGPWPAPPAGCPAPLSGRGVDLARVGPTRSRLSAPSDHRPRRRCRHHTCPASRAAIGGRPPHPAAPAVGPRRWPRPNPAPRQRRRQQAQPRQAPAGSSQPRGLPAPPAAAAAVAGTVKGARPSGLGLLSQLALGRPAASLETVGDAIAFHGRKGGYGGGLGAATEGAGGGYGCWLATEAGVATAAGSYTPAGAAAHGVVTRGQKARVPRVAWRRGRGVTWHQPSWPRVPGGARWHCL